MTLATVPKTVESKDGIMTFGDEEIIVAAAIEFLRVIFVLPSSIPCDFISSIIGETETTDGITASSRYITKNTITNDKSCTGSDGEARECEDSSNILDFIFIKKAPPLQYKTILL